MIVARRGVAGRPQGRQCEPRGGVPRQREAALASLAGLVLAAAVALAAWGIGHAWPLLGAAVAAIMLGVLVRALFAPGPRFDPGIRFTGQLQSFGVEADAMEVVATYDAALARGEGRVETRRFEARVPIAAVDVASVAPALNQAANQIAADVAAWIGG